MNQNILMQALLEYKNRKQSRKHKRVSHSPPKMPISQRQTSFTGHAYSVHNKLKIVSSVEDLIDLLGQMFRIVQSYEIQSSQLWQRNIEQLKLIRIPIQEENILLRKQIEQMKVNDIQDSLFGQLKEYAEEIPKVKVIDLQNLKQDKGFQEEFMSKLNEFSLSWRQEAEQLKQL
ncbi:hypothetical protein pb186bvf_020005 [Paramecium bursaria]